MGWLRSGPFRRTALDVSNARGCVHSVAAESTSFPGKMGERRMIEDRCVDLLYLACNRLEFTQATFTTLLANTDWRYVHELFVYDDGSIDGTREWLEKNTVNVFVPTRFIKTKFGSPVSAMVHFIESASAPILAKVDNDAMLPPAWLRQSLEVLDR